MSNPNTNITLKIFYFSLEISAKSKMMSAISYKLHKDYGVIVSPEKLQSLFKGYILDDNILNIINTPDFQKWMKFIEEHVTFIDDIRHGYGIHSVLKAYAQKNGHYTYKEIEVTNDFGEVQKQQVRDQYIADKPDEYVIAITDHISLLQPSKEEKTVHTAMTNFSSKYMLEARDRWEYIPILVQQQSAASEEQQFTNNGRTIVDKLKPTADALGDNKLVGRDLDLLLALFWPKRYNIDEYHGWDLKQIGKFHRELLILLNRHGTSSASIDLYMNGATNNFKELPKDVDEKIYTYVRYEEELERQLIKE